MSHTWQQTFRKGVLVLAACVGLSLSGCDSNGVTPAAVLAALTVTNASVVEGNAGTTNLVFTVTSNIAATRSIAATYATADGTATAGQDYTATNGTLNIAVGATSGTITVPISGDTVIEIDETFTLVLSAPANATITGGTITGTITNDDAATISIANASVTEGNAGTANLVFTVSLNAAPISAVTVNFATANGTALAASDYTATNGTLTIAAGATSGTVTVLVTGDTVIEPDETFTLALTNPTNATIATASATGTITNDDVATISIANASVTEGNAGTANLVFTVSLSAAPVSAVTVDFATTDGTALAASDYTATNGTLTIAAGATSGTVTVLVTGDTVI